LDERRSQDHSELSLALKTDTQIPFLSGG
jgi:hypothetical protein